MEREFIKVATTTARVAGKPWTFIACVAIVLVWAISGPVFGFSETWQLVINTGTTIVTFLMVFLIQNTQNRDGAAMQAKLDELLFGLKQADNRFIGIEHLTEAELETILREVENRSLAVQAGRSARAIPVKPSARARAIEDAQPKKASSRKVKSGPDHE